MPLTTAQQARLTAICRGAKDLALGTLVQDGLVFNIRRRVTTAQVNAGYTLLTPPSGKAVRVADITMIAIGGAATTVTSVDVKGGANILLAVAAAALTQSTVVRAGATNAVVLADGASFVAQAASAAITVIKAGADMTVATNIDILLSYCLE